MKRKHFSEDQIMACLNQANAGVPIKELCRQHGFTEQTFYRWKKQYVGLGLAELRELKDLRDENRRLKRIVADLTLDKQMLQEVVKKKF